MITTVTGGIPDSETLAERGHRSVEGHQVEAGHQVGEGHLVEAGHLVAIDLHLGTDHLSVVVLAVEGMA